MVTEDFDVGFGDAGAAAEVFNGGEGAFFAGFDDALGGLLAHAGKRGDWRQQGVAVDDELRGAGAVEVDAFAGEASEEHFPGELQDDECRILLGVEFLFFRQGLEAFHLRFDVVLAARDDVGVEFGGADGEIRGVVRERIMDFAVGNAVGHHDVGRRVGAREEIFYLLTRLDEPFGDAALAEDFDDLRRDAPALADFFHRLEGKQRVDAVVDEVHHDVIARGDSVFDGALAAPNQVLRVAEPDVGAVGETGNAHEVGEYVRLRVVNHLARERRAELRDAERAARRAEFFGRDAEGARGIEDGHRGFIVERDGLRVAVREVFEHLDDGRVIVAEDVELDESAADGVIIEMGRDGAAVHIVGRMLNRREEMNVHVARHDHNAGRMLARRRFDAHAAMGHLVDVGNVLFDALFLEEFLDVAERCLVGDSLDGTSAIDIVLAEQDFRVFMRDRLIGTGEVQVDIRDFIAVEAEEDGKRDVVAVFNHGFAADRAYFVRQVIAAAVGAVGDEFAVLAFRAAPVRRQRVDLGDTRHGRDERGTDGTTRTDEVAVVVGFLDETLRDEVQHGESVCDNRLELLFESVFDDFRQVLAVHLAGLFVGHLADFVVGARNLRRIEVVRNRLEAFNLVGDFARIRHDGLVGGLFAEVREFLEHFVRRTQIKRRLFFSIVKALALHEDGTVDTVFRVQKMHIAGRDERFAELFGDFGDLEVDVDEVFVGLDIRVFVAAFQEVIVVNRLDFDVIVERSDFEQVLVGTPLFDGADDFAGFAGRA